MCVLEDMVEQQRKIDFRNNSRKIIEKQGSDYYYENIREVIMENYWVIVNKQLRSLRRDELHSRIFQTGK